MISTGRARVVRTLCGGTTAFCLCLLFLGIGCSKGTGNHNAIHGAVKLDGQPLEQGSILIAPMEGTKGTVTGGQIAQGQYRIASKDGPGAGWHRVEIRAVKKSGQMVQKPFAREGEMIEGMVEAIPAQFNSASTLKVEVKPGDNVADFELTSK